MICMVSGTFWKRIVSITSINCANYNGATQRMKITKTHQRLKISRHYSNKSQRHNDVTKAKTDRKNK